MKTILPGTTIGILGGGQLGRMLALAARPMGYRIAVLDPTPDSPAVPLADFHVCAPFTDLDAIEAFCRRADVVTFEFENVALAAAQAAARHTLVRPDPSILGIAQHRLREKKFLDDRGYPVVPFAPVGSADEVAQACLRLGCPAILKSAMAGYDGKGQVQLNAPTEAQSAWSLLKTSEAVLESRVALAGEMSIIVARREDGRKAALGPFGNCHRRHILDSTVWPAQTPPHLLREAKIAALSLADDLDLTGSLCVEFFITRAGELLINELAPRPHNSGHLTIEAHATSQFAQHVRAICGLPLGSVEPRSPAAAMANLLGDLWSPGEPAWEAALQDEAISLHLYGKAAAQPGRKMGHLTVLDDSPDRALQRVLAARDRLIRSLEAPPTRPSDAKDSRKDPAPILQSNVHSQVPVLSQPPLAPAGYGAGATHDCPTQT